MRATTIWLEDADMAALDIISKKTRIRKSALIREGVKRALKAYSVLLKDDVEVDYSLPEILRQKLVGDGSADVSEEQKS